MSSNGFDFPPAARSGAPVRAVTPITAPLWLARTIDHSFWERRHRTPRPGWRSFRLTGVLRVNLSDPVFILGAPRSGTTFLGGCLGRVPMLSYHHEPVMTKAGANHVYQGDWGFAAARRYYRFAYGLLMRLHGEGGLRFAEKTPRNAHIWRFLQAAFPGAKFIHIYRDGRDAALSATKKPWLSASAAGRRDYEPGGYRMGPYARHWVEADRAAEFEATTDFHRGIWTWRRAVEAALNTRDLPPDRLCEIRYETLADGVDDAAERLADFLDLDRASANALRDGLGRFHSRSIGGWRRELSEDEVALAMREAGPLLDRLGYTG